FGTRGSVLSLKCLLPCVYRRYLLQLRHCRYIDEYRCVARECINNSRNQLIWVRDSLTTNPKCFSDSNGIHFASELDAEITLTIVQALQHLDPSKAAIIEQNDGDWQMQARDGREFRARHAERAIAHQANDTFMGPREGRSDRGWQGIA